MRLSIDGTVCDLEAGTAFDPGYDAERLRSPERLRKGHRVAIVLPRTERNELFFAGRPAFNAARHEARLTHDGATLYEGTVRLLAVSDEGFRIDIRGGAAGWARSAALGRFRDIPLEFDGYLDPEDIRAGWSDARPVKFFPVVRDGYPQRNASSDLQPVLRMLTPDDYHPFLHVASLVRALFAAAGYAVRSDFMETPAFKSLYMSGAYAGRDTTALERRMGFRAVRLTAATAAADAAGRVYATPYGADNVLGNIVESATPLAEDETGAVRTDPYNNGNCFGYEDRKIVYRPAAEVSVGFEYRLRYTTDHRIVSRWRLAGFDAVNLGAGGTFRFVLPNRYEDRRRELRAGASYRAVVFDAKAGDRFRLLCNVGGTSGVVWTEFAGRTAAVATPLGSGYEQPALQVMAANGTWKSWNGDWALYDGHIAERGRTTVELTLRTPAVAAGPASPVDFNTVVFGGAEEGMRMTLHAEGEMRPRFSPAPAFGARVGAADVMHHDVRQIALLEAVQQMFNLRFWTDEQTRSVRIEPDRSFWDEAGETDWRGRTDFGEPAVWRDAAVGEREARIYAYREGDGPVKRMNDEEQGEFGAWRSETGSWAAEEGTERRTNALFAPTASSPGGMAGAPSAWLMQVGDRDDAAGDGVNFTPRIVRYAGMMKLPDGELWPASEYVDAYPLAAFHCGGDKRTRSFTLGFADRDGVRGLHTYHDRSEAIVAARRRVTLTLRIGANEFERLFRGGGELPAMNRVFRIDTDEGEVCATLHGMESYDPEAAKARCTFTLLPEDRP